jgi:hypothetical protein
MFPGKRATIAPLYQERNSGKVVLAVPGVLAEPYHAFKGLVDITKSTPPSERFGKDYANRVAGKALDVSGAVGVGGFASPKPAGALGTFGGKAVGAAGTSRVIDSAGYYSAALEAARSLKQAKGTPEQMRAQLRSGGMTEGEAAATKLDKFLEGKKSVTREELVQHLEGSRIELKATRYNHQGEYPEERALAEKYKSDGMSPDQAAMMASRVIDKRFGRAGDPKFQRYSLDPQNPTYTETVLSLGERPSVKALEAFRSGHFPEPNIIGHYQSSLVKDAEGRKLLHLDQVQSDWGQRLRDGGVRDEAKIAELTQRTAEVRKAVADNAKLDASLETAYREATKGNVLYSPSSHPTFDAWAKNTFDGKILAADLRRLEAELRTVESAIHGHPLVNTTDQWLNTTLRHALKSAVAAGAEGIAVPKGKTVLGYNPGDTHGMETFYNQIVPKNLGKIIGKLDPAATAPHELFAVRSPETNRWFDGVKGGLAAAIPYDQIAKNKGAPSFTAFYLTPKVKEGVITGGQPLFARHPTGGVVPGGSDKGDTGETYQRTYKTGPKAGTTETVRKAK